MGVNKKQIALTEEQQKHIDKFRKQRYPADRKSFPPLPEFESYPSLAATCAHLNRLYGRFAALENDIDKARHSHDFNTEKTPHRMRKNLRRKLAPQLMLALQHANKESQSLSAELKARSNVKTWSNHVKADWVLYTKDHEPTASLLLPYRRRGPSVGGSGSMHIDEEYRRREKLKFLALAKGRATLPIHKSPNILQEFNLVRSKDPQSDTVLKGRALEQARQKLETGLREWEMIERYMVTFIEGIQENIEQWSATMDGVLERVEVQLHISNIKRVLGQAEMYLAQVYMSAIDLNV